MANDDLGGYPAPQEYGLKVKIADIVSADAAQMAAWVKQLKDYVNDRMQEDNSAHAANAVSKSQEDAWTDCFNFIAVTLASLSTEKQQFELIFEYSLPGTVHERPDVFLLTDKKAISLEFKRKSAPQVDDNKDDVAQAIRYSEQLKRHHEVTKQRDLCVESYLVCTYANAKPEFLRGIRILTKDNFCEAIEHELDGENICSFIDDWLASQKTEMPDMLEAIEKAYRYGEIPYIADVNKRCLDRVKAYINDAVKNKKKIFILIDGVPGAGKTAVGQTLVYEANKLKQSKDMDHPKAVYLSGNGPLVEVLQYQIDWATRRKHAGKNAVQGMKEFKTDYFYNPTTIPEQYILIFDEAQRAWDKEKMGRDFSEPEGLFRVGNKIHAKRGYAAIVGLYGNGQSIYEGEETGIELWRDALLKNPDWYIVVSETLAAQLPETGTPEERHKCVDKDIHLQVSLRADFIDCSRWVEQVIDKTAVASDRARIELETLQNTALRICLTRDVAKVKARMKEIDVDHPDWRYGILVSNFAEERVVRAAFPTWKLFRRNRNDRREKINLVENKEYGQWFAGESRKLNEACSVFGNQGLELDCPIILFGGEYVRKNGEWTPTGGNYEYAKRAKNKSGMPKYKDIDTIVENNFRVLLTRARKEMILLIPEESVLDETYQYFVDMGMDIL